MDDPFTGEHVVLVRALQPDVAVLQVQMCDAEGNARIYGPRWENAEAARAAKKVVVITEELVPVDIIRQQPEPTAHRATPVSGGAGAPPRTPPPS